jgi:SAM-dependent methyltransferase
VVLSGRQLPISTQCCITPPITARAGQFTGPRRPPWQGRWRRIADETFDKALAINSMQAWPDARAGLREIRRVLKHGGNVALGFTVNSGQPKEGVAELLAAAGFAQPRIVDKSKLFCAIATRP